MMENKMEVDDVAVQEGVVGAEERVTSSRSRYVEVMKMDISVGYMKGISNYNKVN